MTTATSWITVDLKAIDYNIRQLRRLLKKTTAIMAVVKSDAYGHGLFEVSKQAIKSGASSLGVATLAEAVALRKYGVIHPIFLLMPPHKDEIHDLIKYKIVIPIGSEESYRTVLRIAGIMNRRAQVYLDIDTGLGGAGFVKVDDVAKIAKKIDSKRREFQLEGILSQLACLDDLNLSYTSDQILAFEKVVRKIESLGIKLPTVSISSSAGAIMLENAQFNCVRIGIAMYGIWPSRGVELWCKRSKKTRGLKLRPALSYKTRLSAVKRIKAGSSVGFGGSFQAHTNMTIGVIPVGYYEGYDRSLSNMGFALLKGAVVPIVGNVCMNMTFLDIGKRPRAKVGDEVVLIGKSQNKLITATDLADWAGTIHSELISNLPAHITRVYRS